jgi:hypothetical protein
VLSSAAVPLTEPTAVELRARLRPDVTPAHVEKVLRETITTPLRRPPQVTLEEVDGDALVVSIAATPLRPSDGSRLAGEVLSTVTAHMIARDDERSAPEEQARADDA